MKKVMKSLAFLITFVLIAGILSGCTSPENTTAIHSETEAKYTFTTLNDDKTNEAEFTKDNKVNYFSVTLEEDSDFALLAYNGNLEDYYNIDYKIYQDMGLTECVHEGELRVTDTDMWGDYKTLAAGTYYITLSSEDTFEYYLTFDAIPVK